MMSNRHARQARVTRVALGGLLSASLLGCGPSASRIQINVYPADSEDPKRYAVRFDECWFLQDESHDYHIVARAVTRPESPDVAPIEEWLAIRVYWRPKPAKTHDNPGQTDATLHYLVKTGAGSAVYAGTGFVYAKKRWPSPDLQVAIERAQWRLVSATGDAPSALAPALVTGQLIAAENRAVTTDLLRNVQLAAAAAQR